MHLEWLDKIGKSKEELDAEEHWLSTKVLEPQLCSFSEDLLKIKGKFLQLLEQFTADETVQRSLSSFKNSSVIKLQIGP